MPQVSAISASLKSPLMTKTYLPIDGCGCLRTSRNRRLWRVQTIKDTTPTVILSMSFVGDMIVFPIQDFFCSSKLREVKKIPVIIKDKQILDIIETSLSDTSYRDTHQDQLRPEDFPFVLQVKSGPRHQERFGFVRVWTRSSPFCSAGQDPQVLWQSRRWSFGLDLHSWNDQDRLFYRWRLTHGSEVRVDSRGASPHELSDT